MLLFLLLTRIGVAVFVSALQRWGHAPKIIHVKRLNVLTKWIQANPKRLVYGSFTVRGNRHVGTGVHQRVFSDSAFKKEEQTGHCMRGVAYLLCPGNSDDAFKCTTVCNLLDFNSRQQRKVVRATFSAELLRGCDAIDKGILLSQMPHEIYTGDCTVDGARQRRDHGGYHMPLALYIDAMSVYAAVTAPFINNPADNGMLSYIQYLRELLDNRILTAISWVDTRDMLADGATKGSIDKSQLHSCMSGTSTIAHELKLWKANGKMRSIDLAAVSGAASFFTVVTSCLSRQPNFTCHSPSRPACQLSAVMAAPASTAMDAMTQMVLAGEGGLMAAMVAIENDAALAASLAVASVPPVGTHMVQTEGAGIRQDESIPMDIRPGEPRQGEPGDGQITLPPITSVSSRIQDRYSRRHQYGTRQYSSKCGAGT